jgi:hypothetical protein
VAARLEGAVEEPPAQNLIANYSRSNIGSACRAPCRSWKDEGVYFADCMLSCAHTDAACTAAKRGHVNAAEAEVRLGSAFAAKKNTWINKKNAAG